MALTPGTRLGPYIVSGHLGSGGMGEVYQATDTNLKREVALKVLPASVAADAVRLARFQREAEVLAALNHPNIAAIYGLEKSDGIIALVMELVEGDDLSQRIAKGAIPIDEALPIAKQIAEALEAAHEQGIIHRDLKPANIKVRSDGTVKVLDFGLAKAMEPAAGSEAAAALANSPTITSPAAMTAAGIILGTAAYMSPEQARGKPVDKRTDLWAFGCVLYEVLTCNRAFPGEDVTETIAAVVRAEPNWSALPTNTPTAIRRLLRRCLEKDRSRRLDSAANARLEIEEAVAAPDASVPASSTAGRQGGALVPWLVTAFAAIVAITGAVFPMRQAASDLAPLRFEIATPPTTEPTSFALSPDGRQLVFVATGARGTQLWLRPLEQVAAQPLAETEGASQPFWAPDSRSLGFFADGHLKRLQLGAGRPQVLAEARNPAGAAWNQDGDIVYSPSQASPLMRVAASGGPSSVVTRLATGEGSHRLPAFLPDGRRFLFVVSASGPETEGVYLASLETPEARQRLLASPSRAYAALGSLLFMRKGVLMAAPFDAASGSLLGDPTAISPQADSKGEVRTFSVSSAGLLAYRTADLVRPSESLVWVDRGGRVTGTFSSLSGFPELTSDGRQVAVAAGSQGTTDIWLVDAARGIPRRFTFDAAQDFFPVWSPDGSRLIFSSNRKGTFDLFEKPASIASDEQVLLSSADNKFSNDWSPDGRFLLYVNQDSATDDDLWALPLTGTPTPIVVAQTRFAEEQGQFSPDGRWVVYRSNELGRREIFLRPFPGPGSRTQVSTGGGIQPRWRRDGRELYYFAPDNRLMAVPIRLPSANGTPEMGAPVPLFSMQLAAISNSQRGYSVAPDGRFLMWVVDGESKASPITIVQNWVAGLKR